jgi:hypothetical protein
MIKAFLPRLRSGVAGQAGKNNLEFPAERDQRENATQLARINDCPLKHQSFLVTLRFLFKRAVGCIGGFPHLLFPVCLPPAPILRKVTQTVAVTDFYFVLSFPERSGLLHC